MCRILSRGAGLRYAVRMFSLPRRWLLTAVSASLLGCEAESVAPVAARPEPLPQAGRLPEPTPSAGGEAGDEGGEPGVDDGEPTTPPDLPAEVPEEVGPPSNTCLLYTSPSPRD